MWNRTKKLFDLLVDSMVVISFIGVIIFGSIQVFSRYLFQRPLFGTEEVMKFLGVWLTFVGTSIAVREDAHIKVDTLYLRLSPGIRKVADWAVNISILIFNLFILFYGYRLSVRYASFRTPALRWSMSTLYAAVTFGAFLNSLYIIRTMLSGAAKWSRSNLKEGSS